MLKGKKTFFDFSKKLLFVVLLKRWKGVNFFDFFAIMCIFEGDLGYFWGIFETKKN